ncbi:MAG: NAD-dependent epimerase/dehydratase family protein [Candidatus Omnitrophota bacterium]
MKILVTGGMGFIGSHLVDTLVREGHSVSVFDNLEEQVHQGRKPDYLNRNARYVVGDVRDREAFKEVLLDSEIVFHQAAAVGVGQSMYRIAHYINTNDLGTANLLDIIVNEKNRVKKLIVASSMSIYGEGAYNCPKCGPIMPGLRCEEQLKKGDWQVYCPLCNSIVKSIPTKEDKALDSTSIYAFSKRHQEEICLLIGKTYKIPVVALRYFNIYGPRQALSNPYTGVCAIFSSRIKNNHSPIIYEDGLQSRDFIHVSDIARANILAMKDSSFDYKSFNVGSGKPISILEIANILIKLHGKKIKPQIINKYRKGDIRHCFADISKIKQFGFHASVDFEDGMKDLVQWSKKVKAEDRIELANKELEERGLTSI